MPDGNKKEPARKSKKHIITRTKNGKWLVTWVGSDDYKVCNTEAEAKDVAKKGK